MICIKVMSGNFPMIIIATGDATSRPIIDQYTYIGNFCNTISIIFAITIIPTRTPTPKGTKTNNVPISVCKSKATIERIIKKSKKIKYVGSSKKGYWEIVDVKTIYYKQI